MKHNHVAVILAAVANNVLGYLVHAPFTFLSPWARGLGLSPEALAEPSPVALAAGVVGSVIIMYAFSWLLGRLDVSTWREGARLAVVVCIVLILPFTIVQYAFAGFGLAAIAVDGLNQVATAALAGTLIGGWRAVPRPTADPSATASVLAG